MQWGDSITNATVEAGFGYIGTGAVEELDRFFYHPDHIGSSSVITNAQGIVTECMAYMPFGEILATQKNTNYAVPYLFTSKELDSETGLYYFGARYYDPNEGRWWGVDPLAEKFPNSSPYIYCNNNPAMFIDEKGKFPLPIHEALVRKAIGTRLSSYQMGITIIGATKSADWGNATSSSMHFDNMSFAEINQNWSGIQKDIEIIKRGIGSEYDFDFMGFYAEYFGHVLHQTADFYSHSNYIEVYLNYYKSTHDGNLPSMSEIPTYEEALKDQNFKTVASKKLNTTAFDIFNLIDFGKESAHKEGKRHHNDTPGGSLDKNNGEAITGKNGQINIYEAALQVAQKDVNNKADEVLSK